MQFLAPSTVALALCLVACSGEGDAPATAPPLIEAIFEIAPGAMLTPYPSNRYVVPDAASPTGLRPHITPGTTGDPLVMSYASTFDQINAMDGFSTTGGVIVSFTGPIDLRGLVKDELSEPPTLDPARDADEYTKQGSPLLLVNVDPASPERGRAHGLVPRWWEQRKDDYYTSDDFTLIAHPEAPLLPGTRYLFVVTRRQKARGGAEIGRSADTERLLRGELGDDPYAAEVLAGLDEVTARVGVPREDIVLATSFTTASILGPAIEMAKAARASAAPALVGSWEVEKKPAVEEDTRLRFRAVYEAPEYRKALPDGKWLIEEGKPVVQKSVGLEVFLAFADATKSGPRPVVIYAHGLGGDKEGSWTMAEQLVGINAAVLAIDSPEHGSRSAEPGNLLSSTYAFFGMDPTTYAFDVERARDNFRQMGSDQLSLVRFIGSLGSLDLLPEGAPDGVPDLDVSRILYIGHSFGSVQGPMAFALSPEITQAVWNVGGGGLTMILRDSGAFGLFVNAIKPEGTPDGALARFFSMAQAIVDPGDPLNYARFGAQAPLPGGMGWTPRDILLQEVIDDGIVPNSATDALARAAGALLIEPVASVSGLASADGPVTGNLPGGATVVMSQFDRINVNEPADHGDLIFSAEGRAQYTEFFRTGLSQPHATVVPVYSH